MESTNNDIDFLINEYLHCFYLPKLITFKVLNKIFLPKFLKSKTFSKYVNELINGSQFKVDKVKQSKTKADDKQDDETALFIKNPNDLDLLWQRPKPSMQIGQIDSYGRYKTSLDHESFIIAPSNKSLPMKFFNMLNLNEQENGQSEEEMAFKVAEMLVNDVVQNNRLNV